MSKRDNFSYRVRKSVETKSNAICNNPKCNLCTNKENNEGIIHSIGRACHIEAAAPGGPRYNAQSTPEYRKSIDNAIWLCSNCADLIDKDYKSYPVSLLKEWKSRTENINTISGDRIFAIVNSSGGVGCSSVTAFLSSTFAAISNNKVLCISSDAHNHSGMILVNFDETAVTEIEKSNAQNLIKSIQENIDFINDESLKSLFFNNFSLFNKEKFKEKVYETIKENGYKYVFIDCGNGYSDSTAQLLDIATDIIIPIGEHSQTSVGIGIVGDYLKSKEMNTRVWPIFSIGLRMNNKQTSRVWYYSVMDSITKIGNIKNVELINSGIIIPKNSHVNYDKNLFENYKTRNVADAYFNLTNYILNYYDEKR